jgi:RNA polymerase sigma-70 factor (ECF subfamily)
MECKQIFAKLSEYLDAELPADLCAEMDEHIFRCEPCVEFIDSLRRTIAICQEYRPDTLPAPLKENARQELMAAYRRMVSSRQERGPG